MAFKRAVPMRESVSQRATKPWGERAVVPAQFAGTTTEESGRNNLDPALMSDCRHLAIANGGSFPFVQSSWGPLRRTALRTQRKSKHARATGNSRRNTHTHTHMRATHPQHTHASARVRTHAQKRSGGFPDGICQRSEVPRVTLGSHQTVKGHKMMNRTIWLQAAIIMQAAS